MWLTAVYFPFIQLRQFNPCMCFFRTEEGKGREGKEGKGRGGS